MSNGAEDLSVRPCPSAYVLQGWGAHQLASAISADSAKISTGGRELGRTFSSQAADLGLSAEDCGAIGPREKIRRVAESATSTEKISQFSQAGAQLNLLRNCEASLRSATAGVRCWGCFCDVTARPRSPSTEEGVLARSSFFGAGSSIKIYVAHLEKACPSRSGIRELEEQSGYRRRLRAREGGGPILLTQTSDLEIPAM